MNDFIKLNRKIMEWEWYKNEHTKNVFIHCLLKAYWKDTRVKGEIIHRGSFISSIGKIAEELDLTIMEVRTALKHLKSTNEITSKGTNRNTVFTVTNYDLYQANEQAEQQTDNKQRTNKEQTNNEQITNKQQAINKPSTTNEEYKEVKELEEYKESKKEKKDKKDSETEKRFVPPTVDVVEQYCLEKNCNIDAENFVDFYTSKGWMVGKNKMKDWKAAVRTWDRNDKKEKRSKQNTNRSDINANKQSQLDYLLKSIREEEINGRA